LRALVTGASGFVGRHLAVHLEHQGWDVAVAAQLSATEAALEQVVRDAAADSVFHLAGLTTAAHAADLYAANVVLTARLLDAIERIPSPPTVVLIGSAAEYGRVTPSDLPVREDQPCCPVTDYAISKYAQTLMGLARAHSGMPVVIVRLWNPVGRGMPRHLALASFAHQVAALPRSGGTLRVGNLDVERDFLDVREAARLIAGLARNPNAIGKLVNVCSGRPYRLRPLVEAMAAKAERTVEILVEPHRLRPGEPTVLFGDTSRLAALGLHPAQPDFDVLLGELVADAQSASTSPRSRSS